MYHIPCVRVHKAIFFTSETVFDFRIFISYLNQIKIQNYITFFVFVSIITIFISGS